MNIKKFMIVGMVSVLTLVGCNSSNSNVNAVAEVMNKEQESAATEEVATEDKAASKEVVEEVAEPAVDPVEENKKVAMEQIQSLASLIGKKAEDVDAVLGKPANVQNLEDSNILLVRYYKVEYLNEIAKVEVIFNDHEQVVNYVSFSILKADDIEASKTNLANALTELYGESTIERFLGVNGRQNRNWMDDTLTYDLTYYGDNISLDIYPSDK